MQDTAQPCNALQHRLAHPPAARQGFNSFCCVFHACLSSSLSTSCWVQTASQHLLSLQLQPAVLPQLLPASTAPASTCSSSSLTLCCPGLVKGWASACLLPVVAPWTIWAVGCSRSCPTGQAASGAGHTRWVGAAALAQQLPAVSFHCCVMGFYCSFPLLPTLVSDNIVPGQHLERQLPCAEQTQTRGQHNHPDRLMRDSSWCVRALPTLGGDVPIVAVPKTV